MPLPPLPPHPACHPPVPSQGAKIFGDGVWFKTNAAALTPEGANILGFGFGFGNNLTCEPQSACLLPTGPGWLSQTV